MEDRQKKTSGSRSAMDSGERSWGRRSEPQVYQETDATRALSSEQLLHAQRSMMSGMLFRALVVPRI
jgi:hypothetical protein